MFPSLVNCCAIDWFTAWPGDALLAVAEKFLKEVSLAARVGPVLSQRPMVDFSRLCENGVNATRQPP